MKARTLSLVALLSLTTVTFSRAQEAPSQPQQRPRRAAAADATGPAGALVTLEIVLVDRQANADKKEAAAVPSASDLLQLEKQGNLDRVMRVRLSTVAGRRAMVQLGERVPTVSGRTTTGRGGFAAAAQRETLDGPPRFTYSYTMENIGTLVSATPQVEDGGTVLVELQVEQTRLVEIPKPADDDRAATDVARQKTTSLTTQSTVRLKPGEPVLAKGLSASGDEPRGEYIIVTANVEPAPPRTALGDGRDRQGEFRIFNLVTTKARDAGLLLERMLGDKEVRFAVDEATNTVVASGPTEQLQIVEALLQRLDETKK